MSGQTLERARERQRKTEKDRQRGQREEEDSIVSYLPGRWRARVGAFVNRCSCARFITSLPALHVYQHLPCALLTFLRSRVGR